MRQMAVILIAFLASWFTSCSSLKYTYDYDKSADFSKYETYKISEPVYYTPVTPPLTLNDINKSRIEKALKREMEKRRYVYDPNGDLTVIYSLQTERRAQYNTYSVYYGSPYYYGYPYYYNYHYPYYHYPYYGGSLGVNYADTYVSYYHVGTLNFEIKDSKLNQTIWTGTINNIMSSDTKDPDKFINTSINEMFLRYPYKAGDSRVSPSFKYQR